MEIINEPPPNWVDITFLNPPHTAVFCYGDKIYNPSGNEVPEDVIFHEKIHSDRQDNPAAWWITYLTDPNFRYQEELIAYAGQYAFITRHYPSKAHKEALDELAEALTTTYRIPNLNIHKVRTALRLTARAMLQ